MSCSFRVELGTGLSETARDVLFSRLSYSLAGITECKYLADENAILLVAAPELIPNFEATAKTIAAEVSKARYLPKRLLHSSVVETAHETPNHEEPRLSSPLRRKLLAAIEARLRAECASYATDDQDYPSMISSSTMERCDYVRTFPQNAYMVDQFPHDYESLRDIKSASDYRSLQEPSGKMLSPATCFHFYEDNADTVREANSAILAKSHCYRHEASWRMAPHRLQEFDMLELVLVGDEGYVENVRGEMIARIWELFGHLGLKGFVETASDPFYFPSDAVKSNYQIMAATKYEFVAVTEPAFQCAVASFNNVGNSLCKNFNIRLASGDFAHSGCIAFGLDRVVVALCWAHGCSLEHWPASVIDELQLGNA